MIEMRIGFEVAPPCPGGRKNTYTMEIAAATVDGQRYEARSRSQCEAALAYKLVEAGVPDQSWQTVNDRGIVCLRGKSLRGLAARYSAYPGSITRSPEPSAAEPG
jgi:hypothetical protein